MEQLFAMSLPLLLYGRQEEAERIFFFGIFQAKVPVACKGSASRAIILNATGQHLLSLLLPHLTFKFILQSSGAVVFHEYLHTALFI